MSLFVQRVCELLNIDLYGSDLPVRHQYPTDEDFIVSLDDEAMSHLHKQIEDLETQDVPG